MRGALVVLLVAVGLGCKTGAGPVEADSAAEGVAPAVPAAAPEVATIETELAREVDWPCGGEQASDCVDNYVRFARRSVISASSRQRCMVDMAEHMARLHAAPPEGQFLDAPPLLPAELGEKIQQAIRLETLIEARANAPLRVMRTPSEERGTVTLTRLFLSAAPVGRVPAVLFRPTGQPGVALPAVLALPGNNIEAEDFLAARLPGLLERGYVVLVPFLRSYQNLDLEHRITLELLCAGSSFTAIRHYEVLLALEYLEALRARGEVGGIALVGHARGAGLANALAWYQGHRLAAVASDGISTYINVSYDQDETGQPLPRTVRVMSDSNAQLHELAVPIANFGMAEVKVGIWPYGFEAGRDVFYNWLDERLHQASR